VSSLKSDLKQSHGIWGNSNSGSCSRISTATHFFQITKSITKNRRNLLGEFNRVNRKILVETSDLCKGDLGLRSAVNAEESSTYVGRRLIIVIYEPRQVLCKGSSIRISDRLRSHST
jgi:hypothetical protein